MVEHKAKHLDAFFGALADPTRRAMLRHLSRGRCTVSQLAAPFEMSLAAASKHIKVLEAAGLIHRDIQGRTHVCELDARPMHGGMEWLRHYEAFWTQRLDALDNLLRAERSQKTERTRSRPAAKKKK